MKVFVYTISKNEEKNAVAFARNMSEADGVFVLDTGSTDSTVRLLREGGVSVSERTYEHFRFDTARNDALELVPDEDGICVCPDLDERLEEGWRKSLEESWTEGGQRGRYRYIWSVNADGSDGVTFIADKIHWRHGYRWVHPVHEVLQWNGSGIESFVNTGLVLRHYPDDSKSRAGYLPLLELSVAEQPNNDRNAHYLGREYMFHGRYEEAIEQLSRHLALPSAVWKDERCASYRYIARCHNALNRPHEAENALRLAVAEAPYLREPLFELAEAKYHKGDWLSTFTLMQQAMSLPKRESYITDPRCYGALGYDYLSIAAYKLGNREAAIAYAERALEFGEDERVRKNLAAFRAL